jgi:hypothetical protein
LSKPEETPSPDAAGTISVRFVGPQGRSVLDVRTSGLTRGQKYTLWVADSTNQTDYILLPAGDFESSRSGSTARFLRDTRFGDPLPQQVGNVDELSGRAFRILDGFYNNHLTGTIP